MNYSFTKMHGLGNDFIVMRGTAAPSFSAEEIRALANRRTGIGFDQLLWLEPPRDPENDVFYRIYNADGGEVEQCGNGARCIARLLAGTEPDFERIWEMEFGGGLISATIKPDGMVSLDMGVPSTEPADLPFVTTQTEPPYTVDAGGETVEFRVISMGNPHAVLLTDDIDNAPVERLGPLLERHDCFPNRANIGFMQVLDEAHVRLRVFERGVGETQACGTGACAAVAAGQLAGLLDSEVQVDLPGGSVQIHWYGPGSSLWLTGEAVRVFEGTIEL